jgi:hypothetical protein
VYQGGLGQQILPYRRWLAGGRFLEHHEEALGIPMQVFLMLFLVPYAFHLPVLFCLTVGLTGAAATAVGIRGYVRNTRPDLARHSSAAVDDDEVEPEDDAFEERADDDPDDEGSEATDRIPVAVGSSSEHGGAPSERRGIMAFRRKGPVR